MSWSAEERQRRKAFGIDLQKIDDAHDAGELEQGEALLLEIGCILSHKADRAQALAERFQQWIALR